MQVEVINSQYTDYTGIDVAPSKGNFTRDINPNTVPYFYGEVYTKNAFYPNKLADLRYPHIVRDYRGQTVVLYPFQYNPVTRVLRVYTQMTVKISAKSMTGGENPLINKPNHLLDRNFELTYQRHFLNYDVLSSGKTAYTPVNDYSKMLVICHDAFASAVQPLINWKKQKGIPTELVLASTVGTTPTAIKNYIQNYYNLNGLTFVLLVGDNAQIPAYPAVAGASDNTYTFVVGTDHYPDLFIGRLSADNITDVQTQVNKIITYEKTPMTGATWYKSAVGIGSDEGPGDDNEYDYEHQRNIRTKLMGFTYSNVAELYDGSQGGADAPGNPTPSDLQTLVNSGVSLINYTGHGSSNSFATTPSYNIGHAISTTATGTLTTSNPYLTITTGSSVLGTMNTTGTYNGTFVVNVSPTTPKNTTATINYTITAGAYTFTKTYTLRMNVEVDDFETNSLTTYAWVTSGSANWFVTNQDPYEGNYCSESGDINDNETSVLEIFANVQTPDTLSFYYKVSSEQYFDFLEFYMDGTKKDEWSGLVAWSRKAYYVPTAGIHNFKWVYVKDYIISDNEDCAWIDEVIFPPLSSPTTIQESISNSDFTVYPNPMQEVSFIRYTLTQNTDVSVQVLDMQGKTVLTLKQNENQQKGEYTIGLHKSMLPAGMYAVQLRLGNEIKTHKIVIAQ